MSLRLLRLCMKVALFTYSNRLSIEWEQEVMAFIFRNQQDRASLVVLQLTVHLPIQGTQVPSLVREDPTSSGQLSLCTTTTEPVHPRAIPHKRNPRHEKPTRHNWRAGHIHRNQRKPACSHEDPVQPKKERGKKRNQVDGFGIRMVKQKDLSLPLPMKTPESQLTAK